MIKGISEIHYYTNEGSREINEDALLVLETGHSVLALTGSVEKRVERLLLVQRWRL